MPKTLRSILPDSLDVIEESTERSEDPSSSHQLSDSENRSEHKQGPNKGRTKKKTPKSKKAKRSRIPINTKEAHIQQKGHSVVKTTQTSVEGEPQIVDVEQLINLETNENQNSAVDSHASFDSLDPEIVQEIRTFISFPSSPTKENKQMMLPSDNVHLSTPEVEESEVEAEPETAPPNFNYDADFDGIHSETEADYLSWRMDPEISLSDWNLLIFNNETRQTEKYHVHKNVLAVGPKQSEYFVRLFQANERLDFEGGTTEIHMQNVAAKAIPQWLDYVYSLDDSLVIDTPSATGLRYLAQFFGTRVMHKKAMLFITRDLSMDNILTYYKDTVALADDKVSEIAARHCSEHILEITEQSELLTTVDPFFFRRLMAGPGIDSEEKQYHVSRLLGQYCSLNTNVLDEQSFQRLTEEEYLPLVDHRVALGLLEFEADFVLVNLDEEELQSVTSLQRRCIRDLAIHWQSLGDDSVRERVLGVSRKLPSVVVGELLVESLGEAKKGTNGALRSTPSVPVKTTSFAPDISKSTPTKFDPISANKVKDLKKENDTKIAGLKKEHQKAVEKMQREFEAKLIKLRDICVEKDKHISNYWDELKRFERLPNQPDGKIIPSGIGAKPSKMPSIGNQAQDGYLLVSKGKGGGKHPVFFYNVE